MTHCVGSAFDPVTERRYSAVVFYYPGSKGRLASTYPVPAYPIVIEPFAGSMAYSLHHRPNVAIGVESDPLVESDRGAVSVFRAGPFPRPARRTGRAASTASGSPRARWSMRP